MANPISNRLVCVCVSAALFAALATFSASDARAGDASCDVLRPQDVGIAGSFVIPDQENMLWSDATVDLQKGNRVVISADLTVKGPGGREKTTNIIAVLIGLVVAGSNGFMDYTDDSCMESRSAASEQSQASACAAIGQAWNQYLNVQLRVRSQAAVMFQTVDSIVKWEGPEYDADTVCVVSPRDPASGLVAGESR